MARRMGRAAAVYAALGVLWWATVRLVWSAAGCADWGCLVPSVGALAAVTLVLLAGAAPVLDRVDVRPGRWAALVAAGALVAFAVAGQALPSWTARAAHAVTAGLAFAVAGAVAAYVTGPGATRRRRVLTALGLAGLVPVAFVYASVRSGL
ncbi:hypothetical protein HII36_34815 [Nonomuraea sp. NN258]|uniref:hypothetical protein n=1 Tax=Nonomuraea antri TaxID=2730852 RepID=UPI00156946A2|nr:hypothetical protein [Nonomuraea antri]NRQ36973.1 hypothetical protein [Nonomuraea antri]